MEIQFATATATATTAATVIIIVIVVTTAIRAATRKQTIASDYKKGYTVCTIARPPACHIQ
jgi:hypothetical protein